MRTDLRLALLGLLAAAVLSPRPAVAQLQVSIRLALPPVPRLVVIQPGVQVVEDFDDEVFFHSGVYWVRRDERWYRAPAPHAEYRRVEVRMVPEPLRRLPPGQYRRWKAGKAMPPGQAKKEERGEHGRGDKHDKHDKGRGEGHDEKHGREKD
jgi:hypothetical protein